MKRAYFTIFCLLVGLVAFGTLLYAQVIPVHGLNTMLAWDAVTELEDGTKIPSDVEVSYIVFTGETEDKMTEKARTALTEIPVSELGLQESEKWLGVMATSKKYLEGKMAKIKAERMSSVIELRLLHVVGQ